jgi:hypothetical protein
MFENSLVKKLVTPTPKEAVKFRVFTPLQRVTVPDFPLMKASLPLKRKGLWPKFVTVLSLRLFKSQNSDAQKDNYAKNQPGNRKVYPVSDAAYWY